MENNDELVKLAIEASKKSYSTFSKFKVGAVLVTENGKKYLGCNIENSSYSLTNCAERTAFFKAISDGEKSFEKIIIVGSKDEKFNEFCVPCGACRQVMAEFCNPDFKVLLGKIVDGVVETKEYTLEELLPESFKFVTLYL